MNSFRPSSVSPSSSSTGHSSPAPAELSLDASLERLHSQEDAGAASQSSFSSWLHSSQARSSQPTEKEYGEEFRFTPPADMSGDARPKTSRGLGGPKPFLSSSSRATSIASIAENEAQQNEEETREFGTPFADDPFSRRLDDFDEYYSDTQEHIRIAPGSPTSQPRFTQQSSSLSEPPSSWTVLLSPMENNNDAALQTYLLPLFPSLEDQTKHLREQLTLPTSTQIDFYLDLSFVSALPTNTLARLTPDSWSIAFSPFFPSSERKSPIPTPLLSTQTGLRIAASVRYSLVAPSRVLLQPIGGKGRVTTSPSKRTPVVREKDGTQMGRREAEMTISPRTSTKLRTEEMTASRSFPGSSRTPARNTLLQHPSPWTSQTGNKLRPLSLATSYPLASPEPPHLDSPKMFYDQAVRTRGSSHASHPSNTTSISTHSTRSTSLYSTLSRIQTRTSEGADLDDGSVGQRFWTNFSRLGAQVSRQSTTTTTTTPASKNKERKESVSSEASVFDLSPLGILVPIPNEAAKPTLLGRRRALSSMVPLTGWSAGEETKLKLPHVQVQLGDEAGESITPNTTTFSSSNARARALSFQPSQPVGVWQEAVIQLTQTPARGLFYDDWVEHVDGGIDGDLGRRGSTVHAMGNEEDEDEEVQGVEEVSVDSSALSVLHESQWPLPQQRPDTTNAEKAGLPKILEPPPPSTSAATVQPQADLAQKLQSPGSLRLLCLAASRLNPQQSGSFEEGHAMARPRSFTTTRSLSRKKAELLTPIVVPGASGKPSTRIKRSLSGFFDLASPVRPDIITQPRSG